jgi:hypothetical protein
LFHGPGILFSEEYNAKRLGGLRDEFKNAALTDDEKEELVGKITQVERNRDFVRDHLWYKECTWVKNHKKDSGEK